MHATLAPLLQMRHIAYVFWVELCKLQHGAVLFLFWASNISEWGHFAPKSLLVASFAFVLKCKHVIHVVGAEKCENQDGALHLLI